MFRSISTLTIQPTIQVSMSEIVRTDSVLGGDPRIEGRRIEGRRIGVLDITERVLDNGVAPEQVAADYDLELADVYRALTYYYDNAEEMRRLRREKNEKIEQYRTESTDRHSRQPEA